MEDNIRDRLKGEAERVKREAKKQTAGYLISAFGIVAGLAWNDAVKTLIEYFYPASQNTLLAKFLYAVVITAVVVFVSINVSRMLADEKKN